MTKNLSTKSARRVIYNGTLVALSVCLLIDWSTAQAAQAPTHDSVLAGKSENEIHCLALNIYFEARGEPEAGQRAVGHVVMNRVDHRSYPSTVCGVIRQGGEQKLHRCQFSWWCDGKSDKPKTARAWKKAQKLAREIYIGNSKDPTNGALWYHATYVSPYWRKSLIQGDRIGQHIFYLNNDRSQQVL